MRVLIVDPDPGVGRTLPTVIGNDTIRWTTVANGSAGLEATRKNDYALVILEVVLPGMSGATFLTQLRRENAVPVLVLSSRGAQIDRAIGLEIGADAYLAKPADPTELRAQVGALLRRKYRRPSPTAPLAGAGLKLYPGSYRVTDGGKTVHLTSLEFDLLALMMRNAGSAVTRDDFARLAHGRGAASGERALDTHVRNLRRKLGSARIRTKHGVGYVFPGTAVETPTDATAGVLDPDELAHG